LPLAARLSSRCSAETILKVASLFATFVGVGPEEARSRASLRPPPKLDVQFSRIQLSRRCIALSGKRRNQSTRFTKPNSPYSLPLADCASRHMANAYSDATTVASRSSGRVG
jgi:hypothetical protein